MSRIRVVIASAILLLSNIFLPQAAQAQANPPAKVEHSRGVYHVKTCPGPASAGTARCFAHVVTDSQGHPLAGPPSQVVTPSGYGPADLRAAYGLTSADWGSGATTVAVVDAYGYDEAEADLAVYRAKFGLPACTTSNGCFKKVNQRGQTSSYPREDTGWAQETALDLDMVSAMCPGCKILLVQADSPTYSNLANAENAARVLGAKVISNSYGGPESGSSAYEPFYNYPGVAVTVSSGDSGYGVSFPASSNHVTAVGGTSLTRAGTSWSEAAWSGAGSGCSTVYAKPSWQTDAGCAKRTIADVSAVADPATGVAVYGPASRKASAWMVFGGTSVGAPLIAGIYGANGHGVNNGSDPYANQSALKDVTSGSNGSCGGSYLCTAGPSYDGPTGLGTPKGVSAF
ncbi:MAG: S53 family peptidase [Sphingobium sp.]|nr:S53 family peptidase [Sphingobium sp.]